MIRNYTLFKIFFIVIIFLCPCICKASQSDVRVALYKFENRQFKKYLLCRMREESMDTCFMSFQEGTNLGVIIYADYMRSYDLDERYLDMIVGVIKYKDQFVFLESSPDESLFRRTRKMRSIGLQCIQTCTDGLDDGILESFVLQDGEIRKIDWENMNMIPIIPKAHALPF